MNDFMRNTFNISKYNLKEEYTRKEIEDKSKHFIFPFKLHTGFSLLTNRGQQANTNLVEYYSQFKYVFSGKSGLIAQWVNSTHIKSIIKDSNNDKLKFPYYEKTFTKGQYIKGWLTDISSSGSFGTSPASKAIGDFIEWENIRDYTILTTHDFGESEMFQFYIIPTFSNQANMQENQIMFIKDIDKVVGMDSQIIYNRVTFSSVNDYLETTGQSVQGFINFGAPGEGYAWPKVEFDKGVPIDFDLDQDRIIDVGVKAVQLEFMGPVVYSAPIIKGRPIKAGVQNNKIYSSRDILVLDNEFPLLNELSKKSAPVTKYLAGIFSQTLKTFYKDWKEAFQQKYNDTIKKTNEGILKTDQTKIKNSNRNMKSLGDKSWILYPYKDGSSNDMLDDVEMQVQANPYFSLIKDITTNQTNNISRFSFKEIDGLKLNDYFNIISFFARNFPILPVEVDEIIPWSLSQIPIIGKFLNTLTLGIPLGWRQVRDNINDIFPKTNGIYGLIGKDIYDFATSIMEGANKGSIPIDILKNGTKTDANGFMNYNAMTSSFMHLLTDKCKSTRKDSQEENLIKDKGIDYISTVLLGQNNNGYFENIDNNDGWIVDKNFTAVSPQLNDITFLTDFNGDSYILDMIGFACLGQVDVRITCYSEDPDYSSNPINDIVWQQTLQTDSKFSENSLVYITMFKTSYIDDFIEDNEIMHWPGTLPVPEPTNIETLEFKSTSGVQITSNSIGTNLGWDENWKPDNNYNHKYKIEGSWKVYHEGGSAVSNMVRGTKSYYGYTPPNNKIEKTKLLTIDTTKYGGIDKFLEKYGSISLKDYYIPKINMHVDTFRNKTKYMYTKDKTIYELSNANIRDNLTTMVFNSNYPEIKIDLSEITTTPKIYKNDKNLFGKYKNYFYQRTLVDEYTDNTYVDFRYGFNENIYEVIYLQTYIQGNNIIVEECLEYVGFLSGITLDTKNSFWLIQYVFNNYDQGADGYDWPLSDNHPISSFMNHSIESRDKPITFRVIPKRQIN